MNDLFVAEAARGTRRRPRADRGGRATRRRERGLKDMSWRPRSTTAARSASTSASTRERSVWFEYEVDDLG